MGSPFTGGGFLPRSSSSGGAPLSDDAPAAPGTASAGVANTAARGDHVHAPLIRKVVTFFIATAPASSTTVGNRVTANTNYPHYTPPRNCTLTGISAIVNSNPAGSTALVRIQVEGVTDSTLTLSIPAGAEREHITTGTGIAVTAQQNVRAVLVTDGSWTNTAMITTVDLEFTETA